MSEKPEEKDLYTISGIAECSENTDIVSEDAGDDGRNSNAVGISCAIVASVMVVSIIGWLLFHMLSVPADPQVFQNEFQVMGTLAKISVYSSEEDLLLANELCRKEFAEINRICSLYDRNSELSRLNATAASAPFYCSAEMWELLMRAEQAYYDSDGNFDITVKPLMDLWGFYRKRDSVPSDEEIQNTMRLIGFDKLEFDREKRTVLFKIPGMALDLGGIAKGYAIDRVVEKLAGANINAGIIDLGGNLRMLPEPPPGKEFYKVAIRDPHDRSKTLPDPLNVKAGAAVSTSGDYERFVVYEGKKYGHIISPKTGRPGIVSAVTVVAGNALDADVFSTSCAVGGEKTAEKLKEKYPDIEIHFTR